MDWKYYRKHVDELAEALKKRHTQIDFTEYQEKLQDYYRLIQETEALQKERNTRSKQGPKDPESIASLKALSQNLKQKLEEQRQVNDFIHEFELSIPNIPHESVPLGRDESDNQVVRQWGEIPQHDFSIKDHVALCQEGMSFKQGAKLSGARFAVLKGTVAKLHRVLAQMMVDLHVNEHGYEEVNVPHLVHHDSLRGTGQLPKFEEDLFLIKDSSFGLIPTAEVPLANLLRDTIVSPEDLPKKWVAHSLCFRSEAGSYGKDTHGFIRMHQFEKVELVQATDPLLSYQAQEDMVNAAEKVLQLLELPHRVIELCTGDLGFSATKTFDIEVWVPTQEQYREISSVSNCEDFQAGRIKARIKNTEGDNRLCHTLNGSALAVGRTLVALLENHQQADGSLYLPPVLRPYFAGEDSISYVK